MATPLRTLINASLTAATLLFLAFGTHSLRAESGARFDLAGPRIEVRVTRGNMTLPIAQVPNLLPGDKLWFHPDFPPTQSVHYLLVVAFLRGTTNPPPDQWFTRIETWQKNVRDEGSFVIVPGDAQQVMLFLAPETSGDYSTLRSAVKGRPGVFVRASQDLNEASFEQARIERYLADMRQVESADAKALADHSALLARTLALKPNADCFKQPVDQQYNCLTQSGNQLLLDDGHGQTIASALSNGPSSDFINAASTTVTAGGGLYSAYVGAIVDLVRLTAALYTAQYQYIPAIGFPDGEQLNLRLNAPPSFHNPKSVIVIGLPAIQHSTPPPLRASDSKQIACLLQPKLVLGLDGAPLVYSTGLAHDLTLHLNTPGAGQDIPLIPDAFQGGLIPAPKPRREILTLDGTVKPAAPMGKASPPPTENLTGKPLSGKADKNPDTKVELAAIPETPGGPTQLTGTVKGMWGFDAFTGPTIPLQRLPGKDWRIVTTDPLVAGEDNHLVLASTGTACIEQITDDLTHDIHDGSGLGDSKPSKLDFKPVDKSDKPNEIALTLPLKQPAPDSVHLRIKQYGDNDPDTVTAKALSEPAKLDSFSLHAGDTNATLTGSNLDEVKQIDLKGSLFTPTVGQPPTHTDSSAPEAKSELQLTFNPKSSGPKLNPGEHLTASVTLNDGRLLTLPVTIGQPRPVVTILSKSIDQPRNSPIRLAADDLPLDQKITFFLKSPENFQRSEQIEIGSATDDSLHTMLGVAAGTLVMQNKHTVFATLEPLKLFGPSAFGPLRLRAVSPDGTTGDWVPLATIVRLPTLTDLHCPARQRQQPCTLDGQNLYLVDSFSTDPDFTTPTEVPEGFVGTSLTIPHPTDPTFYVRLRDDPASTDQVSLPVIPIPGMPPPAPQPAGTPQVPTVPNSATPSTQPPAQPAVSTNTTSPTKK
jgi:hypothetical protein